MAKLKQAKAKNLRKEAIAILDGLIDGENDQLAQQLKVVKQALRGTSSNLAEFCDDIDQTGGLVLHGEGQHYVPAASDDWIDLGTTYLNACKTLGRKPKFSDE